MAVFVTKGGAVKIIKGKYFNIRTFNPTAASANQDPNHTPLGYLSPDGMNSSYTAP